MVLEKYRAIKGRILRSAQVFPNYSGPALLWKPPPPNLPHFTFMWPFSRFSISLYLHDDKVVYVYSWTMMDKRWAHNVCTGKCNCWRGCPPRDSKTHQMRWNVGETSSMQHKVHWCGRAANCHLCCGLYMDATMRLWWWWGVVVDQLWVFDEFLHTIISQSDMLVNYMMMMNLVGWWCRDDGRKLTWNGTRRPGK